MNKIVGIVHAGFVDEAESIVNILYIDGKMINGAKYHLRVFDFISLKNEIMKLEEDNPSVVFLFVTGLIESFKSK